MIYHGRYLHYTRISHFADGPNLPINGLGYHSHLWLINYDRRTSRSTLSLGHPLIGPSRHVRVYYCMPKSSPGFLCSDLYCHETFRPLFRRPAPFPLLPGCSSRPLVGVNTESSEFVQETTHPLFFRPPRQPAPLTSHMNITHLGSLVSSMSATNPADRIHILRIIASRVYLRKLYHALRTRRSTSKTGRHCD